MANRPPLDLSRVTIRRLRAEDAPALVTFYNGLSTPSKRTFRPLGEKTTLEACLEVGDDNDPQTGTKHDLIAVHQGGIIGWTFIWALNTEEPTFGLAISDAFHGRGLGNELTGRMLRIAGERRLSTVYLTVVTDNRVAWNLYERHGFVRYGEFIGEDGLPYYRMRLDLVAEEDRAAVAHSEPA